MKYLKAYQIYEMRDKSHPTMSEFSDEIDDLLLPFSDIGYITDNRIGPGGVVIKSTRENIENMVKFKEIKEDLLKLLKYISNTVPSWNMEVVIKVAKLTSVGDKQITHFKGIRLPIYQTIDEIDDINIGKFGEEESTGFSVVFSSESIDDLYIAYILISH